MNLSPSEKKVLAAFEKATPLLYSDIVKITGPGIWTAFSGLVRKKVIEAVFPEAQRGDSGRQFWRIST